jgi:hypothetical protein
MYLDNRIDQGSKLPEFSARVAPLPHLTVTSGHWVLLICGTQMQSSYWNARSSHWRCRAGESPRSRGERDDLQPRTSEDRYPLPLHFCETYISVAAEALIYVQRPLRTATCAGRTGKWHLNRLVHCAPKSGADTDDCFQILWTGRVWWATGCSRAGHF